MGLFDFFKQETRAEQAYSGFESFVIAPSRSLQGYSTETALSVATVYSCVDLIVTNVSQLSFGTFKAGTEVDSPLIVRQPDQNRSLSAFLKRTVYGLTTDGNAYWFKTYNSAGQVNNLEVLDPTAMQIDYVNDVKTYFYGDYTWTDKQVVHLRRHEVPGHIKGYGPLQFYRAGIQGAIGLHEHSRRTVAERGVPSGVLAIGGELDKEKADAQRERWNQVVTEGGIVVTDKDTNFTAITLSAADLQFIESVKLSDLEIARIFGVPAAYLDLEVGGTSLTYNNLQMLNRRLVQNQLGAYLSEIEDALTSVLPRGTYVEFDLTNLLRGDDAEIKEGVTVNVNNPAA